jgi:endonuclease/exonuclease/phosphatase family metal-dependent hydrolase
MSTCPTYHPKYCLDYVLTSKEIKVKNYEVLKFQFSDHLPVLVDFEVK